MSSHRESAFPALAGVGVDVVRVDRIAAAMRRFGERFVVRILGPAERAAIPRGPTAAAHVAKRFAAKEALLKALGTGLAGGATWHDIEVRRRPGGQPWLRIGGACARKMRELGAERAHLSLSDEGDYAVAVVVLGSRAGAPGQG